MKNTFRLTICQLNPIVGNFQENLLKVVNSWNYAKAEKADMLALPEMFITGYQTQDLVLKSAFLEEAQEFIKKITQKCSDGPAIGIGHPVRKDKKLYNAYSILKNGKVTASVLKQTLPNNSVFDEKRLFSSGPPSGPYAVDNIRIGSPICEDAWYSEVSETLVESGAELLLVPNGSPYARSKYDERLNMMVSRVVETNLPLVYLNMVGGQDDQVFDGGSFVLNPGGKLAVQLPFFEEYKETIKFVRKESGWIAETGKRVYQPSELEKDYHAMVVGLRDYTRKTGFKKALLGISGGIDSALVATIATDALGPENVRGVMLPSEFTSDTSLKDAKEVTKNLGVKIDTLPISNTFSNVLKELQPFFKNLPAETTEENIQSRLRGLFLMAMSNKFDELLLTTGNKSEVAVGYSTIYGDMAGGFNPIKDLYKSRVFETCKWRNNNFKSWMLTKKKSLIPENIIFKAPTAELRDNQKDEDSLPPYEILDDILEHLIDYDASVKDCVARGHDRELVKKIEKLIYLSEYKRFQAAPGITLTGRSFWLDRRYPIVNQWRDSS
jgi:NAD+ synthase